MFSDTVLYEAAHIIYANEFAGALERRGGHFPGGQNLCNYVPALTPAEHDPIIRPAITKIDKALGKPLADIFAAGGIVGEETQIDALSDLLLGVQGHGVSIGDNYADQWDKGCLECEVEGDLPYCDCDFDPYGDLANEKLDAAGYPPEPQEDEDPDPAYEPVIATAFSWHGGQGSALYAFASTRQVQSETHRANTLDEIDADLARLENDDTREPGDLPKLRRLRQAVQETKIGEKVFYI